MECFLDVYRESAAQQLSSVLIINEILAGQSEKEETQEGASSSQSGKEEIVRYRTMCLIF